MKQAKLTLTLAYISDLLFIVIMSTTTMALRAFRRNVDPHHHISSTVLNKELEVLSNIFVLSFMSDPPEFVASSKITSKFEQNTHRDVYHPAPDPA